MVKVKPVQNGRTSRMSFSRINEVIGMPNLIEIQKNSYNWFLDEGLREVFHDIDAIEDYTGNLSLEFVDYRLDKHPKYTIKECKERDATYAAPLYVTARLLNKSTGEVKEQEIFMGDFPLMTDSGTFISNGAERVIVSQLVRSPGVFYASSKDRTGKDLFTATMNPNRGAWLEYETDSSDVYYVRIDKNRKLPVTTFLRALGLGTGEEVGDGERVRFVDADLVIVDEFSMVDMWLAQQFFKRIGQHTRVVLVGDPNQLPSVGAGNVFYELIHSGMVPVTVLDWIFRQSKDGLIAYNAKFINEGSTKLYYGNDFVFVDSPTQIETARRIQDIYCKEAAERGIENVQILSPFREKGEAASEQLNRAIRERVNPFRSTEEEVKIGSRIFRVHDRVMQTKNTEKVSNGDLGFITGITTGSKGERLVQMEFGGDRKMNYTAEQLAHVDLAYATTIHKAMGSEFETVIIPIVKAHTIMLYRNLLYTAVTRAKKKVILVGHKPILFMAVHRADISKRNTMLGERIRLYCKAYHTERNALPELQQAG